jgi:ATP-dependent Clp protease ATP-binding subunit ClpA
MLDNKQVVIIATTNDTSFAKSETTSPEIISKFEVLHVEEPSETAIKQILANRLQEFQKTHGITYEEDFLDEVYVLAKQYLPQLAFPAKGLGLLEELVSHAKSQKMSHIKKDMARLLISQKTHIPIEDLTEFDRKNLSSLAKRLKDRVKGQDQAIDQVVKVIQRSRLGFGKKNRPIGSFLFVGPSGVGKTELAKAVAQAVFGDEESMVRLDMSEFSEAHTIQRLVGAPPGYIGFEEGGQLTNPIKAKPYNLVLMDEIEKANARVFDIFLQVLDDGRLTDGQGKMVDFKHTIIIATSNAGLDDILDLIAEGKSTKEIEKEVKEILQDYFRLEFINRFDGIIFFNSLLPKALEEIAYLQIEKLKIELAKREIDFAVSDNAIKQIANMSYDPRYGARELLRVIQDTIENKLAEMIIAGQLEKNQKIVF